MDAPRTLVDPEISVNVRTLDGKSTTITIPGGKTVQDLRDVLKESFSAAEEHENFHLFFKGKKLNLEDKLGYSFMGSEDFIVLMPYRKKKQQILESNPGTFPHENEKRGYSCNETQEYKSEYSCSIHGSLTSKLDRSFVGSVAVKEGKFQMRARSPKHGRTEMTSFAETAWSDILSDLSSVSAVTEEASISVENKGKSTRVDPRDKDFLSFFNLLDEHLCVSSDDVSVGNGMEPCAFNVDVSRSLNPWNAISGHCRQQFYQIIDSVNCLSDSHTGSCLLFQEFGGAPSLSSEIPEFAESLHADEGNRCICPLWLKKLLKLFTFLNIIYAYLQRRNIKVSLYRVNELLQSLKVCGLDIIQVDDIEHLSILCPKAVEARKSTGDVSSVSTMILDPCILVKDCYRRIVREPTSGHDFGNITLKRQHNFVKNTWKVLKHFRRSRLSGSGSYISPTLGDVLMFVKGENVAVKPTNLKRARKNKTTASDSYMVKLQCKERHHLLPPEMLEHLRNGIGSLGQIVHVEHVYSRSAVHVEFPDNITVATKTTLSKLGISKLYIHQEESISYSLAGENVVVSTSTASGKSLCYNVPVLEALSQNLAACAIYIFPTKALAQDQLRVLLEITKYVNVDLNIGVYDGDTDQTNRMLIRDNARLLITNPDMLHKSILPFHSQFCRILSNLRFVVIDEAHSYKAAFGCHTALILRRLRRLSHHVYGSDPSFILCTATSANPRDHALELTGLKSVKMVQNDGSPSGSKLFVMWNPPLCLKNGSKVQNVVEESLHDGNDNMAKRYSPILEAACIFSEMVQHGLRCIAFCKTRKLSELVLCYSREILQEIAPNLVDSVSVYRAGYVAQERRQIEKNFFSGKLFGITATNALELGIDIGHIDATLHLGFPGSIASLWQQAGRAGRRENSSLSVYIAFEGPLDQYFMKFPNKLFGRPIENCQIDVHNQQILEQHITCAAFELPLSLQYDEEYFGPKLLYMISSLRSKGYLDHGSSTAVKTWNYIGHEKVPSHAIGIRSVETVKYQVIEQKTNTVIEEIEESKAFFQVYEGAVYMQQGKTYLVTALDLCAKIAFCKRADLKYYTKTRDYTDIHVLGSELAYPVKMIQSNNQSITAQVNACKVTTTWFGFFRVWRGSNQIFDKVDIFLPEYCYESQAVWVRVPESTKTEVENRNLSIRAGLHAASHAMLNLVSLYIMSSSSDLGTECANPHETRYFPLRLLLYDQHPGGFGISSQIQPLFGELLCAALELVTTCNCWEDKGCPNCIQNFSCPEYNEVLSKAAAILVLKGVVESENLHVKSTAEREKTAAQAQSKSDTQTC